MLKSTLFVVLRGRKRTLPLHRFFIGYWILKRGWIFILALFLFYQLPDPLLPPLLPFRFNFFPENSFENPAIKITRMKALN